MIEAYFKKSKKCAAYRRLFLSETGRLKPEAETVLDDLYDFARFYKNAPLDAQSLAVVEGGRQVVRHIVKFIGCTEQEIKRHMKLGEVNND